jgi:Ca2+-dependent lipid-binding protein
VRALLQGALLVRLVKGIELPAKDGTTSDPFCTFKLGKHKEQKSFVCPATLQPAWNQKFEWLNVRGGCLLRRSALD